MEFLDCNISYGPDTMKGAFSGCPDIRSLSGQLTRAGISGGLVYYAMNEPIQGNAVAARDILASRGENQPDAPRLYGVWSILPSCTGEIPPPASLPSEMKRNGISALTLNPLANRFLSCATAVGDYLEMAQERAIPVLLNTGRGLAIESAECLMREFRQLTAILTFDNCWPSDRLLRPFLEAYPNLCLDMAYMQTAGGLQDIVGKYSAQRILFGSGYPECYMGAHMMVIKHVPISDADRELVAGGNLKRLIGEARYD